VPDDEPFFAVIVAVVLVVTADVFTVKVAVALPAVKVTVAGTLADPELLDRFSTKFAGAAELRVTFPVEESPPVTLDGVNMTDVMVGAVMVRSDFT